MATELLLKPTIAAKSIAGSFDINIARLSMRGIIEKIVNFRGGIYFLKLRVAYVNKQFPVSMALENRRLVYQNIIRF